MKHIYLIIIFLSPLSLCGQSGGKGIYSFLNLPFSAKAASLGGNNISLDDKDPNISLENPGYRADIPNHYAIFNYIWYMTGIKYGNFLYNFKQKSTDNYSIGIRYINYGTFDGRDNIGIPKGIFSAADYSIDLIWNRCIIDSSLSLGSNIKPIFSQLEGYYSFGIAGDIGLFYRLLRYNISAAIVLKNIGKQLKSYSNEIEEIKPDLEIGISKKLAHAPFRFSVTLHHLLDYNLNYELSNTQNLFNGSTTESSQNNLLKSSLKHFIFAAEFMPLKSFSFNFGYNYLRRFEMSVDGANSMAGFSFGFSLKLSKLDFSYGRSTHHIAGGSDLFSLVYKL